MQFAEKPRLYTLNKWKQSEEHKTDNIESERQRAENLVDESDRLINETSELAQAGHREINKKLGQRVCDLKYWAKELEDKLVEANREVDILHDYINRIKNAIRAVTEPLHIAERCVEARTQREQVELVDDDVHKNLKKEIDIYNRVLGLLNDALKQAIEQIRLNRKAIYVLTQDAKTKQKAKTIDESMKALKEGYDLIKFGEFNEREINPEEWQAYTLKTLSDADHQHHNSVKLRNLIDGILKQTAEDQLDQVRATNLAFKKRVAEVREAKGRLEEHLSRTLAEISNLENVIIELSNAIDGKNRDLEMAKKKILTRAQRPEIENVKDTAYFKLLEEVNQLTNSIVQLQYRLDQSQTQVCTLRRLQLQIEEDIQRKEKTLFIDNVECETMRSTINIFSY